MKGYLSVQQAADKWCVSVRWVLEGRIPGCERFGRVWAIPEDAVKPKRLTPGVKVKRSSTQKAARKLAEHFLPKRLAEANERGLYVYQATHSKEYAEEIEAFIWRNRNVLG